MKRGYARGGRHACAAVMLCCGLMCAAAGVRGADAGAAHKATPINACALMTADEIAAVIGLKVDPGARSDDGWIDDATTHGAYSSTCLWRASADRNSADPSLPAGGASFAILNVFSWPRGSNEAGSFLQKFRDAAESNLIPSKPVALKIGDESLWWGDGVAVKSGAVAFGISVHLVNGRPKERQMEETLGAELAGRIVRLQRGRATG